MSTTQEIEEEDEDTVVAEYDVYIAPDLQEHIYLLQYPNRPREMPYSANGSQEPLQMRIKPQSGFLELDLGMSVQSNFDKFKGVTWGEALRMAKESGTNAFGLASGFGKGARTNEIFAAERAQLQPLSDERVQSLLGGFENANTRGNVMNKTTLGGQVIQPEEGRPMYMLGAFRGTELHLSHITGVVQMRPQFHHIDAKAQLAKARQARDRAANEPARMNESRIVQQSARTAADDDELNIAQTSAFLTATSEEPWISLKYYDEEADEAYKAFGDTLFVKETTSATKLASPLNNDEYLDAISIPRIEPGSKGKRKLPLTRKQMAEMEEDSEIEEDNNAHG